MKPAISSIPVKMALMCAGLLSSVGSLSATPGAKPTAADYAAATKLLPGNLRGLVRNESVAPRWLGHSGRFWYRRDGKAGPEYMLVDPAAGVRRLAFDHERLKAAIAAAAPASPETDSPTPALAVDEIAEDLSQLKGHIDDREFVCDLKAYRCQATQKAVPPREELRSPDGRYGLLARNDNLYLRELASGNERQLTEDGKPFYSWGKLPDNSLITIVRKKHGMVLPPFDAYWSPDSRFFIAPRVDERNAAVNPFVEWVPTDGSLRPIVHEVRTTFTGDAQKMETQYFLFDIEKARPLPLAFPDGYEPNAADGTVLGWDMKRGQAFILARTLASKSAAVLKVELASGRITKVIEESAPTRFQTNTVEYHQPNIRLIRDGAELIWYSERSGFGHLYLYDALTGKQKRQLTRGNWLVLDIESIDEARRQIYFTASGREAGQDPYYRNLYRASLDGSGEVQLLTPANADHQIEPLPIPLIAMLFGAKPRESVVHARAGVFVDTFSTVGEPPVSVLRSARDGRLLMELEKADASALYATGWIAPTRERVKAADGQTDLYAVYWAPKGISAGERRPIIDAAYGGPQVVVAPRNFKEAYTAANPLGQQALSRLGFAVMTVDGRGTPGRSNAFSDAGYTEFTQVGIDDHISAIHDLAKRHAEIDPTRAGVFGWSWGGTFAAQAILSRPEFYSVAVSGAGIYDYAALYPGLDNYTGVPQYADGSHIRTTPNDSPSNWKKLDITAMADRLAGHLMIVYGDMDENVPQLQAFRLVDALTKADKPYDLVYLPNRTHTGGMMDGYTIRRTWDYFVEHLLHTTPPTDAPPRVPGPGPELYGPVVTAYSLRWVDIKEGTGALATPGSKLTLNYIGWLEDGTQFYDSYKENDPATFEYGARQIGLGWDAGGMDGLRVGGKRRIIIPHQLAYGAKGMPPVIPPYSQLTFDVELIRVEPPAISPATKETPPGSR